MCQINYGSACWFFTAFVVYSDKEMFTFLNFEYKNLLDS